MSMPCKRVAIAKEVISLLDTINVKTGFYLRILSEETPEGDLADLVGSECRVCALGAMLVAKAVLYDHVPASRLTPSGYEDGEYEMSKHDLLEMLDGIFDVGQCHKIEAAFEQTHYPWMSWVSVYDAIDFGMTYPDPKDRLRVIMENIIQNNGDFVPFIEQERKGG